MSGNRQRANRAQIRRAMDILQNGAQARVQRRHRRAANDAHHEARAWLNEHTVRGFGIGPRQFGARSGELCLRVYVVAKGSEVNHPVPQTLNLPGLPDIPTDVVEIDEVRLTAATRMGLVAPGHRIQTDLPNEGSGTFGCLVRKRDDPEDLHLLSNAHVIALDGLHKSGVKVLLITYRVPWKGTVPQRVRIPPGKLSLQPVAIGADDGGNDIVRSTSV